jgi:TonB-dependent receptor
VANWVKLPVPSTFALGMKFRSSYSTQFENNTTLNANNSPGPFQLTNVLGSYTNPTYYNGSFAINGRAYGPTSSYNSILNGVSSNSGAFTPDIVGDYTTNSAAFFNANELISAGYVEDTIYLNNMRLEGGVRFDSGSTHFLANTVDINSTAPCPQDPTQSCPLVTPTRQNSSYFNALPSVAFQWQFKKDSNLRAVYSRGLARPNIGDLVPATTIDPNQTPYPTISTGNPSLVPTLSDNIDLLVEYYLQPLGIIQGGYFFKALHNPIYPVASLIPFNGRTYQETQSINGPNAHIQGIEFQWEQRFSFLPGLLSGLGMNVNYAYTTSYVTFPTGFDGGSTIILCLIVLRRIPTTSTSPTIGAAFPGALPSATTTRTLRPINGTPQPARSTIPFWESGDQPVITTSIRIPSSTRRAVIECITTYRSSVLF